MNNDILSTLGFSFQALWAQVVQFVPELIVALIVLIIGWILANILKQIVERIFDKLKVNAALDAAGVERLTEKAGVPLKAGVFVGTLVKWFVILVFFVAALDVVGLPDVTFFIRDVVLGYLPRVIVAVLILLVAVVVADVAGSSARAAARAADVHGAEFFGRLAYYAIVVFAVLAALSQLQIAPELIQTLFMGVVFAVSLALGLSFGLGGRDAASRYINKMTDHSGGDHHHRP